MANICVLLGANDGITQEYKNSAIKLAKHLSERHLNIVYGGSSYGLMGAFADAAIKNGSDVIGVISKDILKREAAQLTFSPT